MPKHPLHRLGDATARFEHGGVTICIGATVLRLTVDQAKRVGAALSVALVDARSACRPRTTEPTDG
jgi:hypothetical protein